MSGTADVSAALWACDRNEFTKAADAELNTVSMLVAGSGRQRCFIDGRQEYDKHRTPGQACIAIAGRGPLRYEFEYDGPCTVLHLYLPQRVITQLVHEEGLTSRLASVELIDPRCTGDEHIGFIGREVLSEMREPGHFSRLRLDTLAQDLAIHLLRTYSTLASTKRILRPQPLGGLSSPQLKAVCERLMACIQPNGREPSLHELAAIVGLSPTHLCRAFGQSVGIPPYRWLLERRIERSKVLIEADRLVSIAEVASAVGYTNQTAFGRAFRRVTGVSPREWRRDAVAWRRYETPEAAFLSAGV